MGRMTSTLGALLAAAAAGPSFAQWQKTTVVDKMTGRPSHRLFIAKSEQVPPMPSPYEGANTAFLTLAVGAIPGGAQTTFGVLKGQFVCPAGPRGCEVRVRFDDAEPIDVAARVPADLSTNVLVLDADSRVLGGLMRAERVLVEALFYQAGRQVVEFRTPGGTAKAVESAASLEAPPAGR